MRNTETVIGIVVYAGTTHKINTQLIIYHGKHESVKWTLTDLTLCGCVCVGHETKAMQSNSGPRYKRSKLERRLNIDIIWSVVLLVVMCLTAAVGRNTHTHT